jgi:hypothetical protein
MILRGVKAEDADAITRLLEGDAELALQTGGIPIPGSTSRSWWMTK